MNRVLHLCRSAIKTSLTYQQIRTVKVFKRRLELPYVEPWKEREFLEDHYIYDLVEDTELKEKLDLKVILNTFVEGLGERGDIVSVRPEYARSELLLPGLACYASPENIAKFGEEKKKLGHDRPRTYSTITAAKTIEKLVKSISIVEMSGVTPWTIEPWHVCTSLRRNGIIATVDSIKLPEQPIKGPDPSIEGKDFVIHITINKTDTKPTTCRIWHLNETTNTRVPLPENWYFTYKGCVLEDQKDLIESLPRRKFIPKDYEPPSYTLQLTTDEIKIRKRSKRPGAKDAVKPWL